MQDNPYQAPETDLQDNPLEGESTEPPFYVVGKTKFWLLYLSTMGIYAVYWGYKNWSIIKRQNKLNIWPVMRGLFLIFFLHSLMDRVIRVSKKAGVVVSNHLKTFATFIVILMIANRIFDKMIEKNIGFPFLDLFSLGLLFVLASLFWQTQIAINMASRDPEGTSNSRLSVGNIIWIVLGSLLWLLIAVGYYVILTNPEQM